MAIHTLETEPLGMVAVEKRNELSLQGIRFVDHFRRDLGLWENRALSDFHA